LARNRAPPFNSAMQLTTPGREGASQLIARLNGKRSPASRLSARGYGAPPPDHGPAPDGRRHCARSAGTDVSGLAPAPDAAPWLRSAVCPAVTPRAGRPERGTRRAGRGGGYGSTVFDDRSRALDDSSSAFDDWFMTWPTAVRFGVW